MDLVVSSKSLIFQMIMIKDSRAVQPGFKNSFVIEKVTQRSFVSVTLTLNLKLT